MAVVTMRQLLDAGVHFGHQTRRWNPKMKRFIFGERNGIYIIDLNQTLTRIDDGLPLRPQAPSPAAAPSSSSVPRSKLKTQSPITPLQCGMPYINERWLGGMLTNFSTMSGRVKKMMEYERMLAAGDFENMPKKEALLLRRELDQAPAQPRWYPWSREASPTPSSSSTPKKSTLPLPKPTSLVFRSLLSSTPTVTLTSSNTSSLATTTPFVPAPFCVA